MTERELFEAALDREPGDRAAFLDGACAGAPALKERLKALLARQAQAGSFLEAPADGAFATDDWPNGVSQAAEAVSQVLAGRYKLLEQIGEGGMGAVWLALQTEPVRRRVAVKLIKAGMDSRMVLSRFEAERQALALMDHPNIAKVLDGGTTEPGRPFFVMEYVKGVPITQYCDDARLSIAERLELFVPVCQAVQHAHQKGIIHRDLKPSNLLICLYDDKPVPKVIDFGLAKAMYEPLTAHTLYTAHGLMLGTPLYMSPEQVAVNNLDVDTRSDIYSLGVVLYELLTGTTPLEKDQLKLASWPEVLRLIRDTEPPKPSTRMADAARRPKRSEAAASVYASLHFGLPKRPLATRRFQELDWIVMKALDKDRSRRYETANGLARDLQRYLHDEPVEACPPSTWYRFRKFARRNKAALRLVAAAVLGLLLFAGGVGWALWDRAARQTEHQRELAARSAETERAVSVALAKAQHLAGQAGQMPSGTSGEAAAVLVVWRQADDALAQATAALSTGEADDGLRQRVAVLNAQLEAGRQQTVRGRERALRKEHLFRDLDEARMAWTVVVDNHFDLKGSATKYGAAFAAYGLQMPGKGTAELARRIRDEEPDVRDALIVALDIWTCAAAWAPTGWSAKELRALAEAVDNDEWRRRYRAADAAKDRAALRDLSALARQSSVPPSSLHLLSIALGLHGERDEALAVLRFGRGRHPTDFWLHYELGGRLQGEKGATPVEVEEAIGCWRAALALRPSSAAVHNSLGVALQTKNLLDEAIAENTKAIELDPGLVAPLHNRGLIYSQLGLWQQAIGDYTNAMRLDPKCTCLWAHRSQAYAVLGQWAEAAADMDKSLDPHDTEQWVKLAAYRLQAGDAGGYQKACAAMLERFGQTKDPIHAHRIALSCLLIPRPPLGQQLPVELAERSAAGAPQSYWCLVTRGAALYRAGQFESSITQLRLVLKTWPENPDARPGVDNAPIMTWLFLAMAHDRLGHVADARLWFNKAAQKMDQELGEAKIGPLRQQSHIWAICLVLRREAEGLLNARDTNPPTPPPTAPSP